MKPHPSSTMSETSKLTVHKDSRVVSKLKPKIRIIHLIAPEIIKTDVANFQELVQRLTGKPADRGGSVEKASSAPRPSTKELTTLCQQPRKNIQLESRMHILHEEDRIIKKESEEIWRGKSSYCFPDGFGDMDGFIQDPIEFPLLPLESSHFNIYGGTPLCQ